MNSESRAISAPFNEMGDMFDRFIRAAGDGGEPMKISFTFKCPHCEHLLVLIKINNWQCSYCEQPIDLKATYDGFATSLETLAKSFRSRSTE